MRLGSDYFFHKNIQMSLYHQLKKVPFSTISELSFIFHKSDDNSYVQGSFFQFFSLFILQYLIVLISILCNRFYYLIIKSFSFFFKIALVSILYFHINFRFSLSVSQRNLLKFSLGFYCISRLIEENWHIVNIESSNWNVPEFDKYSERGTSLQFAIGL